MDLKLTFTHMESSPAIETHIREKSMRLKKYLDGKLHIDWTCDVVKKEHVSHINVHAKEIHYHAQATAENLYKTIDLALEKIERQIAKKKEKITDKHHQKLTHAADFVS
jgi:putative sigma-54 modulation protein